MSPDAELIESLATASLEGNDQEQLREQMLRFAAEHDDALLRTCDAGHFTGSSLVVDATHERMLLMLHTKAGLWLQPGGHADGQADLGGVAWREATEETGIEGLRLVRPAIDLDIHVFRPLQGSPHIHLDVRYLVIAPPDGEPVGNDESDALRWVTLDELPAYGVDDGLLRLANRAFLTAIELS